MNVDYPIKYLTGGDKYFGTAGTVNTLTRKGYAEQCPNPTRLLTNMKFTLDMENAVMSAARGKGLAQGPSPGAGVLVAGGHHPRRPARPAGGTESALTANSPSAT